MNNIKQLVKNYIDAKEALYNYTINEFPIGCVVIVNSPQYKGTGIRVFDSGYPPNKVPVKLPNNNIWWYDIETVTRFRD